MARLRVHEDVHVEHGFYGLKLMERDLRKLKGDLNISPVEGRGDSWESAYKDVVKKINARFKVPETNWKKKVDDVDTFYDTTVQHGLQQQNWNQQLQDQICKQEFGMTPAQIIALP